MKEFVAMKSKELDSHIGGVQNEKFLMLRTTESKVLITFFNL